MSNTIELENKKIAGCKVIAEYLYNHYLFHKFFEQLVASNDGSKSVIGVRPSSMPGRHAKPEIVMVNMEPIADALKEIPLTYLEVERLDRYGVYHKITALYGDRHWVLQDRAGAIFLLIYPDPSNPPI